LGISLSPFFCSFQRDLKRIAAYSSVVHINFIFISFIRGRTIGASLGTSLFILHGFLSAAFFYIIGRFYHRRGTRLLFYFRGGGRLSFLFIFFFG
jgi:NADH:ubiquinone oxidoreductase subunit 4 (subunit M)